MAAFLIGWSGLVSGLTIIIMSMEFCISYLDSGNFLFLIMKLREQECAVIILVYAELIRMHVFTTEKNTGG